MLHNHDALAEAKGLAALSRHELNAASRSLVGARTIAAKHNLGGRVAALIRNEGLLGGKQAAHLRALVLASLFVNVA